MALDFLPASIRTFLYDLRFKYIWTEQRMNVGLMYMEMPYKFGRILFVTGGINEFFELGLVPESILNLFPYLIVFVFIVGALDLGYVKLQQMKHDYVMRELSPITRETLGRLKIIQSRQAIEHGYDDFNAKWNWTKEDKEGGYKK